VSETTQPRTSGGRFAKKPEHPADYLARIERERRERKFLVDPPMPLAELNRAAVRTGVWNDPEVEGARETPENARRLQAVTKWLRDTAEAGLEPDVQRAWMAWDPVTPLPKHTLRHVYDEALRRCREKIPAIVEGVRERQAEQGRRARIKQDLTSARDRYEKAESDLADARAQLQAAEGAYAKEWGS